MEALVPYLVFPGTCKQAMEYYAGIFGGRITVLQTFKESPINVPEALQNRIFNSEVKAGKICIKASDDLPNHQVTVGSNMSLYLVFNNREEHVMVFNSLKAEGKVLFPINDGFAMVKDKFNVQWMLVYKE